MRFNLTPEKIAKISKMSFADAMKYSMELIDSAHKNSIDPTDAMKMVRMKLNIQSKKNSLQLTKMFYDILLAGEGHGVKGSKWKKQYGGKF